MSAGAMITGTGIPLYRLLTMKHAIRLEAKGMKMSRNMNWTAAAKREFGVKGNRDKVLARVEEEIKKAEANLKLGDIRNI